MDSNACRSGPPVFAHKEAALDSPTPINPYLAPQLSDESEEGEVRHRCSFCGRDTVATGPLVQSPDKRAYICRSCSEIAQQLITAHQSPGMGRLALAAFGALLLAGLLFGVLYAIRNAFGS